jgi:hypothetical protein
VNGHLSPHEGTACPHCGLPLQVLRRDAADVATFRDELVIASLYECEGEGRHRFRDRLWRVEGRVTDITLVESDPDPLPLMP